MNHSTKQTCGVIPPHMLRHLAKGSDPELRRIAHITIAHTQHLGLRAERPLLHIRKPDAPAPLPAPSKHRNVYDAQHRRSLPGKLMIAEGGAHTADVEANEAYDGSGAVWDFFHDVFGRNSIDGRGLRIDSTVHYGNRFDNAMWDGRQMIYGDGDGKLFNRFTSCLDVIGHELTHGVTQFSASLAYSGQSGALNEHVSDAFGMLVKQHRLGLTAAQSDWVIGAGLLAPGVKGKGIRSMAAPGTAYDDPQLGRDPQPAHMRDYVLTPDDNGGVHINSGIPNHAFYLAATAAGGHAWEGVGRVWYVTLTTKLTARAKFTHFAKDTVSVAAKEFGTGSSVHQAVAGAWSQVGLGTSSSPTRRVIYIVNASPNAAKKAA